MDEAYFSGYCRQIDGSRTVTVELKNGNLSFLDCNFDSCIYRKICPIARQIEQLSV